MAVLVSLPPPFTNVTASSAYVFELGSTRTRLEIL
jgi:hypothetical protein